MSTEIDVLGAAITRLLKEARHRELTGSELSSEHLSDPEEAPREVVRLELEA
jgi:hypothetical protein